MEKALLFTIKLKSEKESWQLEDMAQELEELTTTCGAEIIDNITYIMNNKNSAICRQRF